MKQLIMCGFARFGIDIVLNTSYWVNLYSIFSCWLYIWSSI